MISLLKKELYQFFSSAIGFIFSCFFIIISGLFLWVFDGDFNIPNNGFASLSSFFRMAPWLLLIIIPAACMQSFAEEKKQGTLELLLTRPISVIELVLGKLLGVSLILMITLLPTLIYVVAISDLVNSNLFIDSGSIIGSYIALILLGISYAAIGIFVSSLTKNQSIALIGSILICFIAYFGFATLSSTLSISFLENLGLDYHYQRISEGVLDTRDLFFFLIFISFFTCLTVFKFRKKSDKNSNKQFVYFIVGLVLVLTISNKFYNRFDLTREGRFSLTEETILTLEQIETPVTIDVLLAGDLPAEFKKIQTETKQLLESYKSYNPNIKFSFTDPLAPKEYQQQIIADLQQKGLTPAEVSTQYEGVLKKEVVVPWAMAYKSKKAIRIPLLKNSLGATNEERTNASIQNLEYAFTDALKQLYLEKTKTVAVLKGNGQLKDVYIADFVKELQKYYKVAPFVLDTLNPNKTLEQLSNFDLLINAKPTNKFTEIQKLILDQHLLSGKSQLLLLDKVVAEKDSVFSRPNGATLTWNRELNLKDQLFAYGVRINPQLVVDYYSEPLILANGQGDNTQYIPYNWGFSTLSSNNTSHPITINTSSVKFNFTSPIDTLKNKTIKTILLKSSPLTKLKGVPSELSLNSIIKEPVKEEFTAGFQNLAVLLEGHFNSTYKNRILPYSLSNFKEESENAKLILVSDGDIIKNELSQQMPLALGLDPLTNKTFANKDFLLNAVNYLQGDEGLVKLRAKQFHIPTIDLERLGNLKLKWQVICVGFPIVALSIFYIAFYYYRRKRFC